MSPRRAAAAPAEDTTTPAKTPAKPAAKTSAKPAAQTSAKPAARTPAKPAAQTPARPAARTPAKPAAKAPAKPAAKTPARPAARTPATPRARAASPTRSRPSASSPASTPPPAAPLNAARPLPPLGPTARRGRLPTVGERTLDNGLRVLAVRRPGVPLAELRLRIPFAEGESRQRGAVFPARAQLLSDTLLSGTTTRTAGGLAAEVQALGAQLSAGTDADRLSVSGSVLLAGLPGLLDVLSDVLREAAYPKREVVGERDRLVDELAMYRSQAGVVAREALLTQMYGRHAYARELPTAEQIRAVKPSHLRETHADRVVPAGSVLVVVGDLTPARALGLVEAAVSGWTRSSTAVAAAPLPVPRTGPALLVDRPGAVQTTLRMGGPALRRTDPGYAALVLANLVFGGYFCSRWVANIREDKGYTYSPHSAIEHPSAGSRLTLGADVATPTTAAALLETVYELGRVATVPVTQDELDQARRYAVGALALGTATQAGLASTLSQLVGAGLDLGWLRTYPQLLDAVTIDDVLEAGSTYLAPHALTTVLVGDVGEVETPLRRLVDVETG